MLFVVLQYIITDCQNSHSWTVILFFSSHRIWFAAKDFVCLQSKA